MACSGASSDRLVYLETNVDNFGAWAPDLPGCVALGDSVEDAERQMREAIAFHLQGLRDQGEPIPAPVAVAAVMVTTPAA